MCAQVLCRLLVALAALQVPFLLIHRIATFPAVPSSVSISYLRNKELPLLLLEADVRARKSTPLLCAPSSLKPTLPEQLLTCSSWSSRKRSRSPMTPSPSARRSLRRFAKRRVSPLDVRRNLLAGQHVLMLCAASIYVNSTLPQSALTAALSAQLYTIALISITAQLQASGLAAVPAAPCYNSCQASKTLCAAAFSSLNLPFPACPPEVTIWDFSAGGGGNLTTNCTSYGDSSAAPEAACPLSVVFWGRDNTNALRNFVAIMGWIGLVECLFVTVLTALNPRLRKWPGSLVVVLGAGQTLIALGDIMMSFVSFPDFHCKYLKLCKTQGLLFVTGLHSVITTWLVMTGITAFCVWSENPSTALRRTEKYKWFLLPIAIIPIAFCIYCYVGLGTVSATILCATGTANREEIGIVYPLIAQVCLGTLLWLASVVGAVKSFGAANGLQDLKLYVRLLLYEMFAIIPSALFSFPFEIYRDKIHKLDTAAGPDLHFLRVTLWRINVMVCIAAGLAPVLFGTIFLLRPEHWRFIRKGPASSSYSTSKRNGTTDSGKEASKVDSNAEAQEESTEASRL